MNENGAQVFTGPGQILSSPMLSPSRTGNKPFFPISPKNKRNNSFLSEEKEKRGRRKWLYLIISMAENKQIPPPYDLDAKWDACLDLTVRRFVYSSFAGAFGGLLLFSQSSSSFIFLFIFLFIHHFGFL